MATGSILRRIRTIGVAALAATALSLGGVFAGDALAGPATYSASLDSMLSLVSVRNSGGAIIPLPANATVSTYADAVPNASDPGDIGFESGSYASPPNTASNSGSGGSGNYYVTQHAEVSGTALNSDDTFSLQLTNGFVDLDNQSGQDLTFDFSVSYSWNTSAIVTPQGFAEAIASLFVDVYNFDDDTYTTVLDIFDYSSTAGGADGSDVDVTGFLFSVSVLSGGYKTVSVFLDAAGSATVPAPASLLLLGFGLVALRRVRGRAGARA